MTVRRFQMIENELQYLLVPFKMIRKKRKEKKKKNGGNGISILERVFMKEKKLKSLIKTKV